MAVCPECAFDLDLGSDMELGEIVVCENCGADLIVAAVGPIALEAFEEEEK
ncbi:MAG: lysine biosynthesis protein LysW [Candidatus Aquicultorales bacterium]